MGGGGRKGGGGGASVTPAQRQEFGVVQSKLCSLHNTDICQTLEKQFGVVQTNAYAALVSTQT